MLETELKSPDGSVPSLRAISSALWLAFLNELDSTSFNLKTPEQTQIQVAAVITAKALSFPHGGIPFIFLYCISEKSSFLD